MKLSQAFLCLAVAVAAASAASINVDDMHKQLAAVDPRCVPRAPRGVSTVGPKQRQLPAPGAAAGLIGMGHAR